MHLTKYFIKLYKFIPIHRFIPTSGWTQSRGLRSQHCHRSRRSTATSQNHLHPSPTTIMLNACGNTSSARVLAIITISI